MIAFRRPLVGCRDLNLHPVVARSQMRKTGLLEDEAEEEEEEEHVRGLGDFGFGVPSTARALGGADDDEGHDDLNEDDLKVPIKFLPSARAPASPRSHMRHSLR